ncbi:MAG: hypothetical protein WKF97_13925 [Chitinophagaceae bacterium]
MKSTDTKPLFSSAKHTLSKEITPSTPPLNKIIHSFKSTQAGLGENYDRETFIVNIDLMNKVRDIAYWDRQLLKETVEAAFTNYVDTWEKNGGKLMSRPDVVKNREKLRSNSGRKKREK